VTSKQLQELIVRDVFNSMLVDLGRDIPEMRHVAYLTVLTSLLTKVCDASLCQPLCDAATRNQSNVEKLHALISSNLEIGRSSKPSWVTQTLVKYEKTLYLHCALLDIAAKECSETQFAHIEFQEEIVAKIADVMVQDLDTRQAKFKMCFAALSRLAQNKLTTEVVSNVLLKSAEMNEELTRIIFEGGLVSGPLAVMKAIAVMEDFLNNSEDLSSRPSWVF
jgi:hypothetical protein